MRYDCRIFRKMHASLKIDLKENCSITTSFLSFFDLIIENLVIYKDLKL